MSDKRALHWVLKIGNLKKSMHFFEKVLGLKVLRHEEFASGCEATCNGPYAGAWSKTMIGYGPEDSNFALELTYNYGIESYDKGNDLLYIALALDLDETKAKAQAAGCPYEEVEGGRALLLHDPDKYTYKIVPPIAGRTERFLSVALRVSNLDRAQDYWVNLLGLTPLPSPWPGTEVHAPSKSSTVAFSPEQTSLQFIEVGDGHPVDHAKSSGRIAFACGSAPPIYEMVKAKGDTVQTPPLTLPTPGKADVVVTILVDRDGYEICFVEALGFYQLATPTYDVIDYAARAKRGGDGAPPPDYSNGKAHTGSGGATQVESEEQFDELVAGAGNKLVVVDFSAKWCRNCARIATTVDSLATTHAQSATILLVDLDSQQELAERYDVSSVPHFVFLHKNKVIGTFEGSNEVELKNKVASHVSSLS